MALLPWSMLPGGMILDRASFFKMTWVGFWSAAVGLLICSLSFSTHALEAYSLRTKELIQEDGQSYWEIRVTCSDLNTRRFIVQLQEDGPWCAKQVPEFCFAETIDAAVGVCASSFRDELKSSTANLVNSNKEAAESSRLRSQLLEEKVSVQRARATLAERKLELRRKEMDLQKRELEILDRQARLP